MTKKEISKIIQEHTDFWQPEGNIGIIKRKDPFWWRINKRWADSVAEEIVRVMDKIDKKKITKKKK